MKPHLFKVLDKWLAFYRGDLAPTGFTAADTAVDAYRMLVSGDYTVAYQTPVVEPARATADVFYLHTGETSRRPQRNRHRAVKSMCRSSGARFALQDACNT